MRDICVWTTLNEVGRKDNKAKQWINWMSRKVKRIPFQSVGFIILKLNLEETRLVLVRFNAPLNRRAALPVQQSKRGWMRSSLVASHAIRHNDPVLREPDLERVDPTILFSVLLSHPDRARWSIYPDCGTLHVSPIRMSPTGRLKWTLVEPNDLTSDLQTTWTTSAFHKEALPEMGRKDYMKFAKPWIRRHWNHIELCNWLQNSPFV